jgi:hypothetical protein
MLRANDPVEQAFMDCCAEHNVWYQRPEQTGGRLDFYLPDYGLYVEVKAYSTERLHAQLESVNAGPVPVMVLIGIGSVRAFGQMLRSSLLAGAYPSKLVQSVQSIAKQR